MSSNVTGGCKRQALRDDVENRARAYNERTAVGENLGAHDGAEDNFRADAGRIAGGDGYDRETHERKRPRE
jgi:hypothetical protein